MEWECRLTPLYMPVIVVVVNGWVDGWMYRRVSVVLSSFAFVCVLACRLSVTILSIFCYFFFPFFLGWFAEFLSIRLWVRISC
ncbi:hypothetical protein BDV36DRAFT_251937 [Aspergillus pseudocaelatus]|uniref:Uncharacterized protein n=1 Tax=Aspergillus pseudocaelatus TaxID=1825620 RepID=A0ABQ6WQF9_9EURO|nr:hypothetical protein BDV36DRAFT_251937 [Aspergillus pseudocaelatus]